MDEYISERDAFTMPFYPAPKWVHDKEKPYKDIINKAYKDALYDFYKHAFKTQIVCDFMQEGTLPYRPDDQVQVKLLDKAIENVSTKSPYMFLTINPQPGITLVELKKKVEKFAKRAMIRSYKYVFEVRKEDLSGLHCHMLLHYTCKPYDFRRCAKSTFKNICDTNQQSCLNFRYVKAEEIDEKIKYMKGDKKESKLPGVKYTQIYRKTNKLLDMYESKAILGPKVPLLDCVIPEIAN